MAAAKNNQFLSKATSLYKQGRFKEALLYFSRSLKYEDSSDSLRSLDGRAACHERLKMFPEAQADARQMLHLSPRDPRPYLRLAKSFKRNGADDDALRIYGLGLSRCPPTDRLYKELERQRKLLITFLFCNPEKQNLLLQLPKEIINRIMSYIPPQKAKQIISLSKLVTPSISVFEIIGEKDRKKTFIPADVKTLKISNLFLHAPSSFCWSSFQGQSIVFFNCKFSPSVLAIIFGAPFSSIIGLKFISCSMSTDHKQQHFHYNKGKFDKVVIIDSPDMLEVIKHINTVSLFTNHPTIGEGGCVEREFFGFGYSKNALFCSFEAFKDFEGSVDRLSLKGERLPLTPLKIPPSLTELHLCCTFVDYNALLNIIQPSLKILTVFGELQIGGNGGGGVIELLKFIRNILQRGTMKVLGFPSLKKAIDTLAPAIAFLEQEYGCWIVTDELVCKGMVNRSWMVPKI